MRLHGPINSRPPTNENRLDAKSFEKSNSPHHQARVPTRSNPLFLGIIATGVLAGSLNMSTIPHLKLFGYVAILGAIVLVVAAAATSRRYDLREFRYAIIPFSAFTATYLPYSSDLLYGERGLQNLIVLAILFTFLTFTTQFYWDYRTVRAASRCTLVYIAILFAHWTSSGCVTQFSSFMGNPNALGVFTAATLLFPVAFIAYPRTDALRSRDRFERSYALFIVFCALLLTLQSESRSSLLLLITAAGTYLGWPAITQSRLLFRLTFFSFCLAAGLLIYSQAFLIEDLTNAGISDVVLQHTNKRLDSGRGKLWRPLLELVWQRPYLGYGSGAGTQHFLSNEHSAHNLYVQTMLQSGIIGISLFGAFLYQLWMMLCPARSYFLARLSGAAFAGIIIQQNFEICLTQNNLSIGLVYWFLISMGLSTTLRSSETNSTLGAIHQKNALPHAA